MAHIRNIQEYKDLAVKDCMLRDEIQATLDLIQKEHSISPYMRTFRDYYKFKGDFATEDILSMENKFGLKRGHTTKASDKYDGWIHFKWHHAKEPQDILFKKLKELIDLHDENAEKIMDVRSKCDSHSVNIIGKSFSVSLPLNENWGFMIRECLGDAFDELSTEDIIAIEKETNAILTHRDTYGYHFRWKLPIKHIKYNE